VRACARARTHTATTATATATTATTATTAADKTPNEYIRWRYVGGEDREALNKVRPREPLKRVH
jgi:hypothetical protein